MFRKINVIIALLCILGLVISVPGCKNKEKKIEGHPKVQIEMENGDKMVLELYPEYAPITVEFYQTGRKDFYKDPHFIG